MVIHIDQDWLNKKSKQLKTSSLVFKHSAWQKLNILLAWLALVLSHCIWYFFRTRSLGSHYNSHAFRYILRTCSICSHTLDWTHYIWTLDAHAHTTLSYNKHSTSYFFFGQDVWVLQVWSAMKPCWSANSQWSTVTIHTGSGLQCLRDIIFILAIQGWQKALDDNDTLEAVNRLAERFSIPLQAASTQVMKWMRVSGCVAVCM